MNNEYTSTLRAAAYSLSVDEEVLQQCLEQMREVSRSLKNKDNKDLFVIANIKVSIPKNNKAEDEQPV